MKKHVLTCIITCNNEKNTLFHLKSLIQQAYTNSISLIGCDDWGYGIKVLVDTLGYIISFLTSDDKEEIVSNISQLDKKPKKIRRLDNNSLNHL